MITLSTSSGTPITPVEATATWSSGTRLAIEAAPCIRAASSTPRRPVAALALPALATTARIASSRQRSCVSSTGAASTPERVKRAARDRVRLVGDQQAEVRRAARLQPARHARRAEALRQARLGLADVIGQPATQREEKRHAGSPIDSSSPNIRLRFWTACEEVPL